MEETLSKIKKAIELMGFDEEKVKVTADEEHRKVMLLIDDEAVRGEVAPTILMAFNHLFNQILRKDGKLSHVFDLNYYRKERERLIAELARAAAKKATVTKEEVELPPMNSYERRLVHVEVSAHTELKTESRGEGRERRVVIKRLET